MLVLSRKKNESIVVDESIVITVLEIRGDKVRLGIEAPKSVPIHRSEVYAAIMSQQSCNDQTCVDHSSTTDESTPPPAP